MSASSEFEPAARQDFGPTTSNEHAFENVLEHKLADNMSFPIRTPVLRAVPISPSGGDPEPDSTNPENAAYSANANLDREVEYHISEKPCDTEMSVDALSGIVRLEEGTLDNVGRITYPIIQDGEDSSDAHYADNATATLIQAPLSSAIVQNVAKLPQNFTINVDATVSNITAIQNVSPDVSGGSQTLWLPTLLATSAPTDNKTEDDISPTRMSQFIITSESYVSNDASQAGSRRTNFVTETSYRPKTSKVQILSNVSIPKNSTAYSQQYVTQGSKDIATPVYTQNHVYKLSTSVISQKHFNNSVLSGKTPKSQSLIGCSLAPTIVSNSPVKNVSYSQTFTKSTNISKPLNKLNNGANLNAVVAASSGNTQCHILSRVVSGPNKLSVHTGRKSVNTFKSSKNSALSNTQKQSRAIKIIQQTGSTNKSDGKNWPVANVASYKSQQPAYGVVDTNSSKIIQKVGSPTHKLPTPMSMQKTATKQERIVLQSPCGPVLISTGPTSTSHHKGPHYVQSGPTPNLRYVHAYGTTQDSNKTPNISQVSANQQLTAQILQSLSQPKLMLASTPSITNHSVVSAPVLDEYVDVKPPCYQRRIVFGDPSTLLTADDIIGMEERPNLSEELRRYSYQNVALVMLDHTYSLPAQKLPAASPPAPVVPPAPVTPSPPSPMKQTSPVATTIATYEVQHVQPSAVPTSVIGPPVPAASVQMSLYKPQPLAAQDDDAGSVISSVEGDRAPGERGGSDTETAPEVEEEGKTRCICDFTHDDGYMICCDRCGEWQHVDCMGIDRNNIPDAYMCEMCQPRPIDRRHARAIQMRKREELHALGASDSDSSEYGRFPGLARRKRLLTVTTYANTSGACATYTPPAPAPPPPPAPALPLPKRGPKRPKKTEVIRKGTKRKLSEKRVKRKKEMMMNRSKYSSSLSNQSHWQESYESAVTNHYSPELRAKIIRYSSKLGSSPSMASAITAHLCTTVPHAGGKILIATKDLKESTPVIELRGKYMLSNQHRPQLQNVGRAGSQKPGPFVFFYRLPKDNTQICIDTRTYGNEARFVRRSCKPNAELQHCIVKGTLHVYLVTIGTIQSNTEITVGHDGTGSKQPCACGNPKHCKVNGFNSMMPRKSIDYPPREKRSRNRCTSVSSSPMSPPLGPPLTPVKETPPLLSPPIKSEKKSPIKLEFKLMSPVKHAVPVLNFDQPMKVETEIKEEKPEIDLMAKEEMKPEDIDEPDCAAPPEPTPVVETPPEPPAEEIKMEIVEEPIAAPVTPVKVPSPVKAPPPVKASPPVKAEEPIKEEPKVEKEAVLSEEELEKPEKPLKYFPSEPAKEVVKAEVKVEDERPMTRELAARSACHDRSARTSRTNCVTNQDSMDDKTDDSQDKLPAKTKDKDKKKMTREERKMEAIMKAFERMEKAEQRKQEVKERQKRRESDPHPHAADKDEEEDTHANTKRRRKRKGRARTTSQSNRRRLNSADSDMVTSGDEAPAPPSPRASPRAPPRRVSAPNQNTPPERNSDAVNEDLGLSSACLLVEAAVGSVESAFKLPKTKKTMANEWVGRSPERTPSPYRSPYRSSLVSATSLESLVRVASTMIGDLSGGQSEMEEPASPPRTPGRDRSRPPKKSKRITRQVPPPEVEPVTPSAPPQHSAKKRWLRQAISEESDSPVVETFVPESPPNEMITPLKKRRLARESLSCEPHIVPCIEETSPNLTSEDSPVKDEKRPAERLCSARSLMESLYPRDRTRSDSGQGSDDQHMEHLDILNLNLRGPHDSEHIRRIIGVPVPTGPPVITKLEDIKTINNNVGENTPCEESNYNKVVPMEIDTTITPLPLVKESEPPSEAKDAGSPQEKKDGSQSQSADTSGNSSPQRDEMDDIQKKIHSFHTENILILKSRNKKPPKEKRKKVNLNFDLNMVDDQISIQLRTENDSSELNGDVHEEGDPKIHYVTTENIPLPAVETIPLPAEHVPPPEALGAGAGPPAVVPVVAPALIPLPDEPGPPPAVPIVDTRENVIKTIVSPLPKPEPVPPPTTTYHDKPSILDNTTVPFSSRFNSTGLFSGIFSNMNQSYNLDTQINDNVPNLNIIKSAIDRTTSLDGSLFEKDSITASDELKSVQEILTRVNNMDSNNSVLLSGVLKSSDQANKPGPLTPSPGKTPSKYCARSNDPRLNPPPVDKPKPVRRKLSISEYRKRHKGPPSTDPEHLMNLNSSSNEPTPGVGEWSSESSGAGSLSPLRLEAAAAAAADDLEQRLHRALATTTTIVPPKGVFDAQPTASERQRENLSSRLRREFGLALPDDEESRPPTDTGTTQPCYNATQVAVDTINTMHFGIVGQIDASNVTSDKRGGPAWNKQDVSLKWGHRDGASAAGVGAAAGEPKRCDR
ncbi:hypothetical protein JYU34_016682 [Plutella xylostella]|uniref:Histone-lysine N-methyltransferase MLL5 n=1 Tax=Plutella xylostella TaxID=51655 RepID=A0ABQ7Q4K9_PLUXY|nr:hypothetical protein JYU34_016682 [Plutella xylostella]